MYKKLVLLTATVLLGFTWGCARPGDIGPMGPSGTPGTQGQPGMDLIGWHQVLGSYFDTDAMGTLPAAYQVVAPYPNPAQVVDIATSNVLALSPAQSLRLTLSSVGYGGTALVLPISVNAANPLRVSFSINRTQSSPPYSANVMTARVIVAGRMVAALHWSMFPSSEQLTPTYQGGQVTISIQSQAWTTFTCTYDPITRLTDVWVNGQPVATRLPVDTLYSTPGRPNSYIEWELAAPYPWTLFMDDVEVSQKG